MVTSKKQLLILVEDIEAMTYLWRKDKRYIPDSNTVHIHSDEVTRFNVRGAYMASVNPYRRYSHCYPQ